MDIFFAKCKQQQKKVFGMTCIFLAGFCSFQFLLVPVGKEIQVYAREKWEMVDTISHADITGVGTSITGTVGAMRTLSRAATEWIFHT